MTSTERTLIGKLTGANKELVSFACTLSEEWPGCRPLMLARILVGSLTEKQLQRALADMWRLHSTRYRQQLAQAKLLAAQAKARGEQPQPLPERSEQPTVDNLTDAIAGIVQMERNAREHGAWARARFDEVWQPVERWAAQKAVPFRIWNPETMEEMSPEQVGMGSESPAAG